MVICWKGNIFKGTKGPHKQTCTDRESSVIPYNTPECNVHWIDSAL